MKCKDCEACHKGFYKSNPNEYVCTGVKEPFIIENIEHKCYAYPDNKDKSNPTESIKEKTQPQDLNNKWQYAVTMTDSFDDEVYTYLFATEEEAIKFLRKNYNDITAIYLDDEKYEVSSKLWDRGHRAKIVAHSDLNDVKIVLCIGRVRNERIG